MRTKCLAVKLGILRDCPEQVCDELDHVLLADPVLCRAERVDRDLRIGRAGILGFTLSVIGPVDVHLRPAISAVLQACQQMDLAPSVRISPNSTPNLLYQIKGLLVNDRLLGILENHPVVLGDIVALQS